MDAKKAKGWMKRNPTLTGAAAGFAAGSVVPGIGNVIGAVSGAVIGHMAGRDHDRKPEEEGRTNRTTGADA